MDGICISLPTVVKSFSDGGRRMIECQASCEAVDLQGDVILQAALLGSAEHFLKKGVIDIDHLAFLGNRLGIRNPSEYIVGKPLEVRDMGGGNTAVKLELNKSARADEVWKSLQTDPPMPWRSSIYGFPNPKGFVDVAEQPGEETYGATRYLVKSMQWEALALTMNPVCAGIETTAHIVKAMIGKSYSLPVTPSISTPATETLANYMPPPRTREELLGAHFLAHIRAGKCPHAGGDQGNSVHSFREHFNGCSQMDPFQSDLSALALMHLLKRQTN